ncbi:hypothetical protein [Nitratireductor sp. ZSWI3]|uniref:hypothetical protein n=1 Tax=Nitratireductor sp. ZSWI3 TaxID=2966359 RepID=UPI00214F9BDC|nr:hypothetical protein [Nitratireductor sp. ZSWI3]MCR4269141.1 hypothetical protein [Nitratireductor sp. ZSWI3]
MTRIYTFGTLWAAAAITLFIASEIVTVWAAATWALAGLMKFGLAGTLLLALGLGLPGLFAILRVGLLALEAETDPANL